eukprot:scaffold75958_cov29-Tisochrysis_lutea.AAC.2
MAREVLENCHKTISASYVALGQSMGQTLLPQPPANMLVRWALECIAHPVAGASNRIFSKLVLPQVCY